MEFDVFQQCIWLDSIEDLWFFFSAQVYTFCIATAFKVEYRAICPAVFVITNQCAVRVCRQGSFTRTAQTEEQGNIAIFTFVCRAVHAQYFMIVWQYKVQYAEDTFLHFACVSRTTYQDNFTCKVYDSEVCLTCTIYSLSLIHI